MGNSVLVAQGRRNYVLRFLDTFSFYRSETDLGLYRPEIPPEHSLGLLPVRPEVGSLMQMAAAAVGRAQVPWRATFHDLSREGEDYKNCVATLEDNIGSYVISPPVTRRSHRPSTVHIGKTIRLTSATLIIVPQNLLNQWKDEISLHVDDEFLEVLYLDSDTTPVPSAARLMMYDVILMSRQRFEKEMVSNGTAKARSNTKIKAKGIYLSALSYSDTFPFYFVLRTSSIFGCLPSRKFTDPKRR